MTNIGKASIFHQGEKEVTFVAVFTEGGTGGGATFL